MIGGSRPFACPGGKSPIFLAGGRGPGGMDELAAAAAVEAMSVDDATKEEQAPDSTVGTVAAAAVLQAIDGNTGKPKRPDSPSNLPPPVRGARCLHDF